jgi:hypothetical protein
LVDRVGADIQTRLERIRDDARRNADAARRTQQELADDLGRRGIPFFVIKGSVLAEHVYRNATVRSFEDIDLVVPRPRVAEVEEVLRAKGYRLGQIHQLLGTHPEAGVEARAAEVVTRRFYERSHYELPFAPARGDSRLAVDLHWHVAPPSKLRIDPQQLWEQTTAATVAGTRVATLNLEASLIHLAVHATTCSLAGFKLLPLCDIAWSVTRFGDEYRGLWELADAWGARSDVATVLQLVERVLNVPIPAALRRTPPPRHWAFDRVASAEFLVEYRGRKDIPKLQRAWAEILWNLVMHCARWNVARSLRVRLSRAQWRALCWRWRFAPPA